MAAALLSAGAFGVAPARAGSAGWSVVTSANAGTGTNELNDVAVISASDAWAVGAYEVTPNGFQRTLAEHWNGIAWSVVPSQSPSTSDNSLHAVAAVSASDVWAVGDFDDPATAQYQALIEHWNGTVWAVVPGPHFPHGSGLFGVSAVTNDDIWAVGYFLTSPFGTQPLVEHWNGITWTVVPSPTSMRGSNALVKVTAISGHDAWAVGYDVNAEGIYQTLIEHWNGSTWTVVHSPHFGPGGNYLSGVTYVSARNVWAVGYYNPTAMSITVQTLIEHWNGRSWSIVTNPKVGAGNSAFTGVAAVSARSAWVVGITFASGPGGVAKPLIEHWNGRNWSVKSSPGIGRGGHYLDGVADGRGTSDIWTVGAAYPSGTSAERSGQTLIEHCC
ncbi:MAG TPA: hypothetical protein VF898_08875 [Chloroflexota bacterium]